MTSSIRPRDLAHGGLFGAAALLLPFLFHLFHLGHIFMPMYLPLVTLAFFVHPAVSMTTAVLVPIVSGMVTGMPPFYPPVALLMSFELAVMAGFIGWIVRRWPRTNEWLLLVPVLLVGRLLYVISVYLIAQFLELPATFLAGVSLISGWPGMILMIVFIPPLVKSTRRYRSEVA